MHLAGFQKLSLIDYPGNLCCIVFTQGCNFRCSFCHNPDLLPIHNPNENFGFTQNELFSFLDKRIGKLDGVTVTGGEPTLHLDLGGFLAKIKQKGFKVKLDSNGTNPDRLEKLLMSGNVDYVAMDIKSTPDKYHLLVNRRVDLERIKRSVEIIKNSGLDYEFRTTSVPGLHIEKDFEEIGRWLNGAKNYYLQAYQTNVNYDPELKYMVQDYLNKGYELNLDRIKSKIEPYFHQVTIRR